MNKKVLVFPCGSEIGLEIYKSLSFSTHFDLVGGSSVPDHGEYVYENYVGDIPFLNDSALIDRVNTIVQEHGIDYIFPAHDDAVLKFAQARADGRLQCPVITSAAKTCEIARSKGQTYQVFEGIIPTPKVYDSVEQVEPGDFPVFLKPDVGQGSKGTQRAGSIEEVNFYKQKDPTLLILEYLPGKEYTVDCFTDKAGKLQFSEGRERARVSNGISVSSASVADQRFAELAESINKTLSFRGAWFFQVKENKTGELVLMEIAPRIAGTMGLVRCKGVNMALLSLFDAMDYDVSIFENSYHMVIDRALQNSYKHDIQYSHVYLDFDDLVVFKGKINPLVMAFVYQCISQGKQVHLLTKHKDDIAVTLKKYRLSDTFDEVISITSDDQKPAFITETDAIFIDDSFAERKAVYDTCKIPVFDSHMIEGLMEKN